MSVRHLDPAGAGQASHKVAPSGLDVTDCYQCQFEPVESGEQCQFALVQGKEQCQFEPVESGEQCQFEPVEN